MATDDLSAPLGLDKAPPGPWKLSAAIPRAVLGGLSLFVIAVAGWAMVTDDPFGGEPMVVVSTNPSASGAGKRPDQLSARLGERASSDRPSRRDGPPIDVTPAAPAGKTITIIDGTSGKRQEIVLPGPPDGKSPDADLR